MEKIQYIQEKEKTVPEKESLSKNVKKEIILKKGSRISSQKRKSDSIVNEKSVPIAKKRRNNSVSEVTGQETCGYKTDSNKIIHCNSSSRLKQKSLKTDVLTVPTTNKSKDINVTFKQKKYSKIYEKKADHIDNSSSKQGYWYSKLDQLARNSYIPDSDDKKIAHKKAKKVKKSTDNKVVVKIKLDKVPVVHSNGFSRLESEGIKVVPPTSHNYDPNLSYDACDTPPPTTSQKQNGIEDEKSSPTFTDSFESVNGLSQSIYTEEEDDDDLPEFLTNSEEQGYTPKEGDLIWFKYRKYPFWPAKILKITKKPRIRLQILFFGDAMKYSVSGYKKSVFPYFHPNKDIFIEKGKEIEDKVLKESFLKSIKDVTSEMMKKASVSLNSTPTEKHSFELNSSGEESLNSITTSKDEQSEFKLNRKLKRPLSLDSKITDKMLNQCKKRKEKLKERNKILVDFIKTDKVKEHLFGVYRGQIESDSHQKFHSSATEQNHLRFKARSFRYLEDEEQITEVFEVLKDYYKEVSGCEINNIDYIIDVWFPEAVVYSLIKKRRFTKSKAWEVFENPKRSKVEEILEHQQLIKSASPESNVFKLRPPPKIKLRQTT